MRIFSYTHTHSFHLGYVLAPGIGMATKKTSEQGMKLHSSWYLESHTLFAKRPY
jgi:hypothetical protein